MSQKTIQHNTYKAIANAGILKATQKSGNHTSKSIGFMDLHLERIPSMDLPEGFDYTISIAQYYKQNGDMVRDPDIEIAINENDKKAIAICYRNDGLGIYNLTTDDGQNINMHMANDIAKHVEKWMPILIEQGHLKGFVN